MTDNKWNGQNPWMGLAPYMEGTTLYGRGEDSVVLSEIIKNNIASIVFGKSGIGKSSLLSAGISPLLRNENYIPIRIRLVHNTDISYVEQIKKAIKEFITNTSLTPEPDTIVYMIKKGFTVQEVQVEMKEREFGESYLKPLKSVEYMVNTVFSIIFIRAITRKNK